MKPNDEKLMEQDQFELEVGNTDEPVSPEPVAQRKNYAFSAILAISAFVLGGALVYAVGRAEPRRDVPKTIIAEANRGIELPVRFGDLGRKMAAVGVFDRAQLLALYNARGGLGAEDLKFIDGSADGKLHVTQANSGLLLNLLWALGLSNENQILEKGPMMDPQYGGAGRFASTGGWTIAKGDPMNHYGAHAFVSLTADEQALVEKVAQNIYRPCCDNSTYFPDCNHGMAMLGLLELMASQGASEAEMYKAGLIMNSYWFPEQYATIARHLESRGISPKSADPKEILGKEYSSAAGFQRIASLVPRQETRQSGGGGCGVDAGTPAQPQGNQGGGCGL